MKRKSFTLVELIAVIVILSLAIPTLLMMFTQANLNSITTESASKASYYAEALMEEIRSKKFDENDSSPWSSTLGPDGGEVSRSDYDDVDDYNGYGDNPSSGYTRSVSVEYVSLNGTKWQHAGSRTDYKRIDVSVSRNDKIFGPVNLIVLVSGY